MTTRVHTLMVGVAALGADDPRVTPTGEDPVLEPAVELAKSLGATLHVVHVFELPEPVLAAYGQYVPYVGPDFHEEYAQSLRTRLEALVERFGYPGIRCHVVEGSAGRTLVEMASQLGAQVVMVGATRRGKVWRSVLGTTAERVVRGSRVPVLVMHQPFGPTVRRLLLTTDLSPASARLLDQGIDTSEALFGDALDLRAVLVVWFDMMLPPPLREDMLAEAAAGELRRFLSERRHGGAIDGKVRFGEVAREICNEAQEWGADLIVLGTHGRAGFSRFLLGSTAGATLRGAACNVLVVPGAYAAVEDEEPAFVEAPAEHALPALAM